MSDVALQLEGLSQRFGDKVVLDDFHAEVARGETLCLLGRSGVGKSVVLKIILGLLRPQRGAVRFRGVDVTQTPEAQLTEVRQHVGMVFQGSALFDSLTVGENVAYGLRQRPRGQRMPEAELAARVSECLELVALPGIEDRWPAELSGGMKKRVAIARAIAPKPELLLYDEPTTGLDPATCRIVNELIVRLQERLGVSSLVVTHDITTVQTVADRIVLLADGKPAFTGSADALVGEQVPVQLQRFLGTGEEEEEWRRPAR